MCRTWYTYECCANCKNVIGDPVDDDVELRCAVRPFKVALYQALCHAFEWRNKHPTYRLVIRLEVIQVENGVM